MNEQEFVYVIYIRTTPERLWDALLDPRFTREYWQHDNVSDWKPGSAWEHRRTDAARTVDLVGRVIESDPPRRLVLTWAAPADAADAARHSRVTIGLEPVDEMVRLTIVHAELEPGSEMLRRIAWGWPRVLSSLKSQLETGRALPTWAGTDRA